MEYFPNALIVAKDQANYPYFDFLAANRRID